MNSPLPAGRGSDLISIQSLFRSEPRAPASGQRFFHTFEVSMLGYLFRRWEERLSRRDQSRRFRPFEWGLEFIQNGFLVQNPREYLLEYARQAVASSDMYHAYLPVGDYRLEGRHLTFTSSLQTIYPKNNTVHAWYFPRNSRGRAVLVLPQWNSDARGHMLLCEMLNYFGLSALRLSMPHHDLRMSEELIRADYMLSANVGRTLQSVRQAVLDCRAALDWLESQDYRKFAILGTSLGSCIAVITLAHEPRLRVSVQNHISPYFADVVWNGISTRHVRAAFEGHVTLDELRQMWMPISPKAYLKRLVGAGKKSILIHARYDLSFPPELSNEVLQDYKALGLPHTAFELPCGHYTSGEFPFNILDGFLMCNYLRKNL